MIEVEGIVSEAPRARELGRGMMSLELTLSPWRRLDATDNEPGCALVSIEMDLDRADAWLQELDPGSCITVQCAAPDGRDPDGNMVLRGQAPSLRRCPGAWTGASN